MPLWILSNYKLVVIGGAIVLSFGMGWHLCNLSHKAATSEVLKAAVDKLGKGQKNIVDFNQALDKGFANAKDDCVNKPMPDSIIRLLH